ncbi:MAG TPA: lamin tail domain-containing protein, partial [Flavobacteriales bacterium]|nr:lamin tail domain-containing protein [Flavobacteriales bacterium]
MAQRHSVPNDPIRIQKRLRHGWWRFNFSAFAICCLPLMNMAQILAWQFGSPASLGNEVTYAATTVNTDLAGSNLSRGGGVNPSALARVFSATAFDVAATEANAITNNEYLQFTVAANPGFQVSLSTLDCRLRRSSTGPNAYQWYYSVDGTNFTPIGSDVSFTSTVDGVDQTQVVLSGITALQNVTSSTTITMRIYAWGATNTGGTFAIGRYGTGITTNSLAIGGSVTASGCALGLPGPNNAICNAFTNGTDNYTLSIPFTGGGAGVTVVYSGSGTVGGNDPASTSSGTITITGIPETENYSVTFASPCNSLVVAGTAPTCVPPCGIALGTVTATCNTLTAGSSDTYDLSIAYTGSDASITVVNNSGSGTIAGDNPAVTPNGTILISGISELNNYSVTFTAPCAALVASGNAPSCAPLPLAAWDFTGENTAQATSTAEVYNANMDASNLITRGAGATASAAGNSFRTTGFQNDGIATSNTDYFQITLSADPGFALSLSTIDARVAGTTTYAQAPGVSSQFAYSVDGTNFTLIGSPAVTIGSPATLPQVDVSGITALQNVGAGITITLRYYATGQTNTGGWGFNSPSSGSYGLAIGGSLAVVPITCDIVLGSPSTNCDAITINTDSYTLSIPYTGSQTGVTVVNNSGSGTVGGDDPASFPNGTITVNGITEGQGYNVTLSSPCQDQVVSGSSPVCYPPCTIALGSAVATCNGFNIGTTDTYDLSIPYTGSQAGVTVINNSGSGTIGGDDPASFPNGTILISGISELDNYSVTLSAPCNALVASGPAPGCIPPAIAAWDFFGESSPASSAADLYSANLDASNLITRGGGASASTGSNSFRTVGFQNNGISTSNSDHFQVTLSAAVGYALSLATIDARMAGTSSFAASPGVSTQFAYSLDGTNFTLIGDPAVTIGTPATLPQIDLTGISALQNIGSGTTVTLRFYASGQTTTGGWGFTSSAAGVYGLRIGGSLGSVGAGCLIALGTPTATCDASTAGTDTYTVSIPYTGSQLSVSVVNNSASGTVGGDNPSSVANGTILVSGISELDAYSITLSEPCADQVISGPAPLCEQAPLIVINEVDYDETGTDTKEFIELKNVGTGPSTLTGMKVVLYNGSNGLSYGTITLPNVVLAAGDYYVIGSALVPNVDQVAWVQDGIQNGAPDGIRLTTAADVTLDQMSYEGAMLTTEGTSAGTDPNPAGLGLSRLPDGTDTNDNGVDFVVTCITPGVTNGGADSDNDGTPDCLDVCPGNPEPGSACDDLDENTGNDVVQGDCSCAGEVIDCLGEVGGPALPGTTCIDGNPLTLNDVYQENCVCAGEIPDCLGVIGGPAVPGTPCNDNDPSTNDETFQEVPYCDCVGTPCSQNVTLELRTDVNSEEAGWEILYQNDATVVCSGGFTAGTPYPSGITAPITSDCCLPIGCFRLRVHDSAGDGFASGGYQLRESGE